MTRKWWTGNCFVETNAFFVEANAEYWQTELPAMFASLWHPGSNVTSPGLAVGLSEGRIPPLKWHPEAGSSMVFVQGDWCGGYLIAAARASPKWLWRRVGQWQWDQNVPTCDVRAVFKVVLPVYCQFCYFARLQSRLYHQFFENLEVYVNGLV